MVDWVGTSTIVVAMRLVRLARIFALVFALLVFATLALRAKLLALLGEGASREGGLLGLDGVEVRGDEVALWLYDLCGEFRACW